MSISARTVTFATGSPTVNMFPFEQRTWQNGECADSPSQYELTHVDLLTKNAELEAEFLLTKERRDQEKLAAANRAKDLAPVAHNTSIKRRPLPYLALDTFHKLEVAVHRAVEPSVSGDDSPRSISNRADTMFDHFLSCDQITDMQELDNEEYRRRRGRSVSWIATDGFRKARYQVKKAVKRV